jgi:hypothetical protein
MAIIHEFKAIKRVLERQEQKAEFEAKGPSALIQAVKAMAASCSPRRGGPAMDHEPTRKFIMGEYSAPESDPA